MKEMMSEEDGNMSGSGDVEKTQKRAGEHNEDDITFKRIKVDLPDDFPDIDEAEAPDMPESMTVQSVRDVTVRYEVDGDGEVDEDQSVRDGTVRYEVDGDGEVDEDSLSEMNENSDVSQNSISSSNNNNVHQRKNNMDTIEDSQQDERSESPNPVLSLGKAQSKSDTIVENGRCSTRRPSAASSKPRDAGVRAETNEDSSGGSTRHERKDEETVLQRFEKEISDLTTLLLLKEREWNSILKLMKLKEITLAQLKRRKDVEQILESTIPIGAGNDFLQKLLKQIAGETIRTGANVAHVQNSIIETEKEILDLGKQISTNYIHNIIGKSLDSDVQSGSDGSQGDSIFLASNALKSLVNKNKATFSSHSIPASSAALSSSSAHAKVIGEGRQGPIVEVSSLIADYRSRTQSDCSLDKKSALKRPSTPGANSGPSFVPMNQSSNISFSDVLVRMKKLSEKEKDSLISSALTTPTTTVTTVVTPIVTNTKATPASKLKGSGNPTSNNASGSNKPPVGTTLAKLLSSNSVNSGNRNPADEPVPYNNKTSSTNMTNSDKNLSLANLLASAKSRDDPQKKKAENTTVPLCQGCNANKAQFVCAGCANQWYCSRECQVAAWDEHSEMCSG